MVSLWWYRCFAISDGNSLYIYEFGTWQMWPGLVQTAKEGGVNVIETYVFWNGHELSPGNVSEKCICRTSSVS